MFGFTLNIDYSQNNFHKTIV